MNSLLTAEMLQLHRERKTLPPKTQIFHKGPISTRNLCHAACRLSYLAARCPVKQKRPKKGDFCCPSIQDQSITVSFTPTGNLEFPVCLTCASLAEMHHQAGQLGTAPDPQSSGWPLNQSLICGDIVANVALMSLADEASRPSIINNKTQIHPGPNGLSFHFTC